MHKSWGVRLGIGWVVLLVLGLLGNIGFTQFGRYAAQPPIGVVVYGSTRWVPGSSTGLRIVVYQTETARPVPGVAVRVKLRPQSGGMETLLYAGTTDAQGTVGAQFVVPEGADPQSRLIVESRSGLGSDRAERPVAILREYRVLVATDKAIYQPGQVIRMRVLALGAADRRPAGGRAVQLSVADGRGNQVLRRSLTLSDQGVAAADFPLADTVNAGDYRIRAEIEGTAFETTVAVRPYELPRFQVTAALDGPFYQPGATARGTVEARYFFGKPVAGGSVELAVRAADGAPSATLRWAGATDPAGRYGFEFRMPEGEGPFSLEAQVIDTAGQIGRAQVQIPVAREPIRIEAVPESGALVSGVENRVYWVTTTPDGQPVACTLEIWMDSVRYTVESDVHGLAVWDFKPVSSRVSVEVTARDARGHAVRRSIDFPVEAQQRVLLRPDRGIYRVGETLRLTAFSSVGTTGLYVDGIRDGQVIAVYPMQLTDKRGIQAHAEIVLTPEMAGTLALHVYELAPSAIDRGDVRWVVVEPADDLTMTVRTDRETYRPGESAGLDFTVSGAGGEGVPATLGLVGIDTAVDALQEPGSGFEKAYFLLDSAVADSRIGLSGGTLPELVGRGDLRAEQQIAAQAVLAGGEAPVHLPLLLNSGAESRLQYEQRREQLREVGQDWISILLLLAGITVLGMVFRWLIGNGMFFKGIVGAAVISLPALIGGLLFLGVLGVLRVNANQFPIIIGAIVLGAWIFALLDAWVERDLSLLGALLVGLLVLLILEWGMFNEMGAEEFFFGVRYEMVNGRISPGAEFLVGARFQSWIYLSLMVTVGCLCAAVGQWYKRQPGVALSYLLLASQLLVFQLSELTMPAMLMAFSNITPGLANGSAIQLPLSQPTAPASPWLSAEEGALPVDSAPAAPAGPRLRRNFGETLVWLPELATDAQGRAHLELPLLDTITTWRLTALAHSGDGRLGEISFPLRVFQDFFVDFDLPAALTQYDELSLPVMVYNYLDQPQTVRLELERAGWFESLEPGVQTLRLEPHAVAAAYFPIRVTAAQGRYRPTVRAYGDRLSDAATAAHDVEIFPDGRLIVESWSGPIEDGVERAFVLPGTAISGTAQIEARIYPGVLSQSIAGMEALLAMPSGCFEQTSSRAYPNALVLDYLRRTGEVSPAVRQRAEGYLGAGYQRLTTFEVKGGGFSIFGDEPANAMLTAYGLMEFSDMGKVYPVDPALVERTARWLAAQQRGDGSWDWERTSGPGPDSREERAAATAYVVWALIQAGHRETPAVRQGIVYLRMHLGEIEDPYGLALAANALVAWDPRGPEGRAALERLAGLSRTDGKFVWWESHRATMMGSRDTIAAVETTALAVHALIRAGERVELTGPALNYLAARRDPQGAWHSTQATVWVLKVLLAAAEVGGESVDSRVTVSLNGRSGTPLVFDSENAGAARSLIFESGLQAENRVRIAAAGQGRPWAQLMLRYYQPWEPAPVAPRAPELFDFRVAYDRTTVRVGETVDVVAVITPPVAGTVRWGMIELGVPPGFTLLDGDWAAWTARDRLSEIPGGRVERFEPAGRELWVYLADLSGGVPLTLRYRLQARFPVRVQAPGSRVYDYYNPGLQGEWPPVWLTVTP